MRESLNGPYYVIHRDRPHLDAVYQSFPGAAQAVREEEQRCLRYGPRGRIERATGAPEP